MNINYSNLPTHMQDGARRYIEDGIPGGSFFDALVSNDLMRAFGKADDVNRAAMWDWCLFLYNEAPSRCFGSPEIVSAWVKSGGINGKNGGN